MGSRMIMLAALVLLLISPIECLGWRNTRQRKSLEEQFFVSPASLINSHPTSDAYATALIELQELESEPLCHRIAARLLVGNCQLLDGQNEATVLTDTGRAARDFVDFFAASLAICDLERANFDIPTPCHKFRETVLASLPAPSRPMLHVATAEIDKCLEGLARSDSAWSTWHILLHQKLAIVLRRLTGQAENETQEHVKNLDRVFRKSHENAEAMAAHVEKFESMTLRLNEIIGSALSDSVQTQAAVHSGMEGAKSLEQFMEAVLSRLKLREDQASQGFEIALRTATEVATHDVAEIAEILKAISVTTMSLQAQLTMENLQDFADVVLDKQTLQNKILESTHNQTLNLLSSLEFATISISALQKPLVKLREFAGFLVSFASTYKSHEAVNLFSLGFVPSKIWHLDHIMTDDKNTTTYSNTGSTGSDVEF
ncbi:hypothetical protein EsDP_00004135 [Epichloe bromicola]|uniref:Nuclear membrane fusion protein Kar5 n=1 Tax=Epichloe bromicola TaxID=79588 RepID=A0ABQ0CQU1_9HYPO